MHRWKLVEATAACMEEASREREETKRQTEMRRRDMHMDMHGDDETQKTRHHPHTEGAGAIGGSLV